MKIGFITNTEKDPDFKFTEELTDFVAKKGCEAVVCQAGGKNIKSALYTTKEDMYKNVAFVVVLGGDGTILRVSRTAAHYQKPILGVNIGTLGYLADVDRNSGKEAIEKVINNNYSIEKRMMLEVCVQNSDKKYISLNEISVSSAEISRMITFSLFINNDFINTYRADGVIVSTPTGSTAYNLSAGGPILKPDNELIAITAVCAHNLFDRPFVVSGNDVVSIKIESSQKHINFSIDGQNSVGVTKGDNIIIKKSDCVTQIIKTNGLGFYDILRRKMLNN